MNIDNQKIFLTIIIIVLSILVFMKLAGYESTVLSPPGHYEYSEISFNYPSGWEISKAALDTNETVGNSRKMVTGKKSNFYYTNQMLIYSGKYDLNYSVTDLKNVIRNASQNAGDEIVAEKTVIINGSEASYVLSNLQNGKKQILEIAFTKDHGIYYYIVFQTDKIENIQEDIDVILSSMHIDYSRMDQRDHYLKQAHQIYKNNSAIYNQTLEFENASRYDEANANIDLMISHTNEIIELEEKAYSFAESPYKEYIELLLKRHKLWIEMADLWKKMLYFKKNGDSTSLSNVKEEMKSKNKEFEKYENEINLLYEKNPDLADYVRQMMQSA